MLCLLNETTYQSDVTVRVRFRSGSCRVCVRFVFGFVSGLVQSGFVSRFVSGFVAGSCLVSVWVVFGACLVSAWVRVGFISVRI